MSLSDLVSRDPDGATTRYLRVRDQTVKVVTDSPEADGLVSETFCPPGMLGVGESGPEEEPDLVIVDVARDPSEVSGLLRHAAETAVRGEYELTRHYRQPRFDGEGHTVFELRDQNSDEVAALIRTEGRVTLLRPRSGLGDRWLTRVIRDVATRIAKAEGSLVLHSSAFVHDDGAYLVIGDSGAGKSTTAIALARLLPSAGWMGNDRMHLDQRGPGYQVTACPLPLAINKGSLDVMGVTDFGSWSVRAGFPPAGSDWDRFQGEDKLKLSSQEVGRYLGVRVVPHAPLAGVILPRVDRAAGYRLAAASPAHAADVITRNCFSLDDNLYGEDWLDVPVRRRAAPPSVGAFLEHLAKLPVLRCSVGSAADVARLAADFEDRVRR
ncbi:hypothetical protein AB0P12_20970 [Streptomyces subrutilus]|uniref:Serine kinase n=1 Tax=Streptomyces subrutilus TaxID=36818 RepID=A0A5P2UEN9_9ACTN|nr:hypothetical protein [Streptomyces subrutilus]QEU77746.1 hypothetical protein CP968_05135 [Streptomyces subrutilus]WSJ33146.1 hypothetical protein OG479_29755 [Streptomyces subrutilus]GGZ61806.1 hypothetical protein GCM10010371_21500 [Streptomyces subrutilus]